MSLRRIFTFFFLILAIACSSSGENQGTDNNPDSDTDVLIADGDVQAGKCTTDKDCIGLDVAKCMRMQCNLTTGICEGVPDIAQNGQTCDDSDQCTQQDKCVAGVCKGTPKKCPDTGNPCTVMQCAKSTGECVTQNVADSTTCDDGNQCTLNDNCQSGVCTGGKENPACNCDIDDDCKQFTFDLCQGPVSCQAHKCVQDKTQAVVCESSDKLCHKNVCNPDTGKCGLKPVGDGVECDDSNACTLDDVCKGGECTGTPKDCDDKNACTDDSCDTKTGECTNTPHEGLACDDGDVCTDSSGDKCDAKGNCLSGPPVFNCCNSDQDCDDNYGCTGDSCDQTTHRCKHELNTCTQSVQECQGLGCLDNKCTTVDAWRVTPLITFDFAKAMPNGVMIDPIGSARFANDRLEVSKAATLHLPPLPGMGMRGMLRVIGSSDVSVSDGKNLGYANGTGLWGIGDHDPHSVQIDIPKDGYLTRVEYYGLSTDTKCIGGKTLASGNLSDRIAAFGGPQGVLVMWVVKSSVSKALMYRVFDWSGKPVSGEAKHIVDTGAYTTFAIAGHWTGKGWEVIYVTNLGLLKLYKITISATGNLQGPDGIGTEYQMDTPFMQDTNKGLITCYAYKKDKNSADYDVKCKLGEGDWFDLPEVNQKNQLFPQGCIMGDGIVGAWLDYNNTVNARVFNLDGTPKGGQDTLPTPAKVNEYSLFCDASGFDVIALLENNKVKAYRYTYDGTKFNTSGEPKDIFGATMSMAAVKAGGRIMVMGFECNDTSCSLGIHSLDPTDFSDDLKWQDSPVFSKNNKPISAAIWNNGFVGTVIYDQAQLTYLLEGAKCGSSWMDGNNVCVGEGYY